LFKNPCILSWSIIKEDDKRKFVNVPNGNEDDDSRNKNVNLMGMDAKMSVNLDAIISWVYEK